ncbi:hypothetical protein Cni_G02593 [Canna indica]|uniref:Uncharacterized protein n=1 Tax=Canna indica TaxID=4628 RepID=A0AAQ3Q2V2_9LILI|nr:hypothetical protein Cni_G02593 [Canna indica]
MVVLLFKVTNGIKFDVGSLIFDQIVALHTKLLVKSRLSLIFSNLIYAILEHQGFKKNDDKVLEVMGSKLKVHQKLLRADSSAPHAHAHQGTSSQSHQPSIVLVYKLFWRRFLK